jgi:hypothetical protein
MKTRTSKILALILASGCTGALGAIAGPALACGGEWAPEVQIDYRVHGIARAEKQFDEGKISEAAASVIRMMPHIASLNPHRSTVVERAQRILAVAAARSDGKLAIAREVPDYAQGTWLGRTAEQRQKNLDFAVLALRQINDIKKDDPSAQTDLAEALAQVPAHQAEARQILEGLAKKDLIASPEGYAALAELRSLAGDAQGQKLALERCAKMAKSSAACSSDGSGKVQG